MRGLKLAGLAVALIASTSANAATYFARLTGVVTEKTADWFTDPSVASPIRVGDTMTATFRYTANNSIGESLAGRFSMFGMNKATFTVAGLTWTSAMDQLGMLAPPQLRRGDDPLAQYLSIMEGGDNGDLRVDGYSFVIGNFDYGFYQGPVFRGTFDRASLVTGAAEEQAALSPVPELTLWAQMIAGFTLIGSALRQRNARRARWRGLVARLSGRVRERVELG